MKDYLDDSKKDFFQQVFEVVRHIPIGKVTSYGAIAKYLGAAKSARLVGYAMNVSHGLSEKIPAHRVVNRNGLLTGKFHFETPNTMQQLLEQEGVVINGNQIESFPEIFWDPEKELS